MGESCTGAPACDQSAMGESCTGGPRHEWSSSAPEMGGGNGILTDIRTVGKQVRPVEGGTPLATPCITGICAYSKQGARLDEGGAP